ncbi:DNA starvation/stationary phase protection protein Dps [Jannaschia ovalis]|uniref:DNA starvation/stationary phase protection protein Dps n=1 Tax=Jannaschia ovalis TaxID=3038773 RepID=A0ABY8LDV1_9RHOB|nr:DNA starvation/stationary phase protection protein Dps [Jannaschia sp. GRR-S6-38]WGH79494.1 DNA starvation/stationary phase protection protein Dps [Jannaschia sp. GRR-S6-38]
MPESFVDGLESQTQSQVIDLLNARLADSVDLTLAVKQAHWNMRGQGFIGVHEMLDDVADRLREHSDTMAERIAVMGGHAKGTTQEAAKSTTLPPYPVELTDLQEHIDELVKRFKHHGKQLREAIAAAGDAGDDDVEDLFTELSREVDKDAWFIGANKNR